MAVLTSFKSIGEIETQWQRLLSVSPVSTLFLTPEWQEVWWDTFRSGKGMAGLYLDSPDGIKGIASLIQYDDTISFLGNTDTFDYNDFLVQPGYEADFFPPLWDSLKEREWRSLQLFSLLETSPTLEYLPDLARSQGYTVDVQKEAVAPGISLPGSWEDFLGILSKKDRHELRRKLRRLESHDNTRWYCATDPAEVAPLMPDFIKLMRQSSEAKDAYMTPQREEFFHRITQRTAQLGLLRLFFLELDQKRVSAVLCFDYGNSRLLYNSGYDPAFSYYSVGLILKAFTIRDAIEKGKQYFDFLRGDEPYKYNLGGQNRVVYQMVVKRS